MISSSSLIGKEVGRVNEYHKRRIANRIPEGTQELPPAQCLPFDVNLDIMNGGI